MNFRMIQTVIIQYVLKDQQSRELRRIRMTRRAVYLYDNANKDNSVSRTDNFVNVNVFNSVTSPHVLSTVVFCTVS